MKTAKTNILIVEDDHLMARSLERKLEKIGYTVVGKAQTGEAAIGLAATLHPDLILMDIRMEGGGIDGIDAAKQILVHQIIPIVYLTAYGDEETLDRAKVTEPFGYILKPYDEKELRIAIEISLYKHQVEQKMRAKEQKLEAELAELKETVKRLSGQ